VRILRIHGPAQSRGNTPLCITVSVNLNDVLDTLQSASGSHSLIVPPVKVVQWNCSHIAHPQTYHRLRLQMTLASGLAVYPWASHAGHCLQESLGGAVCLTTTPSSRVEWVDISQGKVTFHGFNDTTVTDQAYMATVDQGGSFTFYTMGHGSYSYAR
jgi:hypothetical protein